MLMPVSTTRAGAPVNGCHPHKGDCGDDPPDVSKYTVTLSTLSGDLTGVSEPGSWSVTTSGHRSINLQSFMSDEEMTLILTYFLTIGDGAICFVSETPIFAASITKRNVRGGLKQAVGMFWFAGLNNTEQPLNYLLTLFGTFEAPDNWPNAQELTMTEWEIATSSGAGDAAQGACISEGLFDDPDTTDIVEEVVKINVTAHTADDGP